MLLWKWGRRDYLNPQKIFEAYRLSWKKKNGVHIDPAYERAHSRTRRVIVEEYDR